MLTFGVQAALAAAAGEEDEPLTPQPEEGNENPYALKVIISPNIIFFLS